MKKEIKNIFKLTLKPYMRILPGNLAYSFMMALIPILSIIVAICNSLHLSSYLLVSKLGNIIPSVIINMLESYLTGSGFNSIILVIIGIWVSSTGADALIIASNVIYNYEDSNYVTRKVKAFILTTLIIILIIINLVFLVFGNTLSKLLVTLLNINSSLLRVFALIKWPISFILIYLIIKVLYTASPDLHIKSKTVTKGAIFATISWMLASALYAIYISNFAHYNAVYGGLANIIILMIWLYIMSFILVLGTAINVNEYNKIKK